MNVTFCQYFRNTTRFSLDTRQPNWLLVLTQRVPHETKYQFIVLIFIDVHCLGVNMSFLDIFLGWEIKIIEVVEMIFSLFSNKACKVYPPYIASRHAQ